MRVIPKKFTGYICGNYHAPNGETHAGVMFYEEGRQATLFTCADADMRKLYKALKNLQPVGELVKKVLRIN